MEFWGRRDHTEMGDMGGTRPKEMTTSSIQYPMLNSSNYTVWAMRMKVALRVHKVWETIEPGSTDKDKNNVAIALLFQSIPENLILQVGEQDTSKAIWDAIKSRNLGADRVKEARLQTLMADFDRMKMSDGDSVDDFAGKLSSLASRSAALGETMEESKLVKKFLKCLPRSKYIHIAASLEQVLDLNSTSFEDIVGRLKAYEERIGEDEKEEDQGRLLYARDTGTSQEESSYNNQKCRGGRGCCDCWRGKRGNLNREGMNQKPKKDGSKVICYRCDKMGHYASTCPERIQKTQEANLVDTQEADPALF